MLSTYRTILRELSKGSTSRTKNKILSSSFRAMFEKHHESGALFERDIQNAILFMRSQREYKRLLERYNPLTNLTSEERIRATARRVGLDMPVTHTPTSGE